MMTSDNHNEKKLRGEGRNRERGGEGRDGE